MGKGGREGSIYNYYVANNKPYSERKQNTAEGAANLIVGKGSKDVQLIETW